MYNVITTDSFPAECRDYMSVTCPLLGRLHIDHGHNDSVVLYETAELLSEVRGRKKRKHEEYTMISSFTYRNASRMVINGKSTL